MGGKGGAVLDLRRVIERVRGPQAAIDFFRLAKQVRRSRQINFFKKVYF